MQHVALALAGVIGAATAIVHGILTDRMLVKPIGRAMSARPDIPSTIRRIVPPLLQYSKFSWLAGGIALVVAAITAGPKQGSRSACSSAACLPMPRSPTHGRRAGVIQAGC